MKVSVHTRDLESTYTCYIPWSQSLSDLLNAGAKDVGVGRIISNNLSRNLLVILCLHQYLQLHASE